MIESKVPDALVAADSAGAMKSLPRVLRKDPRPYWRSLQTVHRLAWVCLLLTGVCASWFAYQTLLVPQEDSFTPDWGNAQWIRPAHGLAPVAYFRYATGLSEIPDSAFLTIAASQTFKLYVNGQYIGTNNSDFVQGIFPRAYIYDISSALQVGANVFAIRVANVDEQAPALKVTIGILQGNRLYLRGSDSTWIGTYQSTDVFPRYATKPNSWTGTDFDASTWQGVASGISMPFTPMLTVNPQLYEYPIAQNWMSAGLKHDAYFVRQVTLPLGVSGAWLQLAATGVADIYINGHLFIVWNGQSNVPEQTLSDYLSESSNNEALPEYRAGLVMGMYNIGAYLHPGTNTIAIHVLSPGISSAQVGLDNLSAALSIDMLFRDFQGQNFRIASLNGWNAATVPVAGWEQGNTVSLAWSPAFPIERPGAVHSLYLPDNVSVRNQQTSPVPLTLLVILVSVGAVVGLWFLMASGIRRYYRTYVDALEVASLSYLPSIALCTLLVALSREPQISQPFPYTWLWCAILLALTGVSYLLLLTRARKIQREVVSESVVRNGNTLSPGIAPLHTGLLKLYHTATGIVAIDRKKAAKVTIRERLFTLLREYWPLLLLMLVAAPMILYNLSYEPYWQDELASYYASRGVLAHGLSFFPSGFYYPKSELFSYLLAFWTAILGQQQGVPRMISALEYLASLPLLYRAGCKFFDKRIALLATAMLAFSPISLVWGRQMRMYEQAQLMTLLTAFLFYKALQEQRKVYLVYLAAASLVIDYLSHEEIFIILPALLLCILVMSKEKKRPLPSVMYQKHWWLAGILCASVIGFQLLTAKYSHPPLLGTDSSQQPLIQVTTDNVPFYGELLFFPQALGHGTYPFITINSILATIGCVIVRKTTNKGAKYCALLLASSLLTLTFLFTLKADRYVYPVLPFYYLMAAYAMVVMLRAFWNFATSYMRRKRLTHARSSLSLPVRMSMLWVVSLVCASVLIVPILPLSSYNLFVSRVVGFSYHRHYADYDAAAQYMRQHMQKGDIVIAVSPADSVLYYIGHVDYYFSIDRSMFTFEQNGQIVETTTGARALFNQDDFQAVLAKYRRIWLVSDNGNYQASAFRHFSFPPDFRIVFEGYGSALYFRGS